MFWVCGPAPGPLPGAGVVATCWCCRSAPWLWRPLRRRERRGALLFGLRWAWAWSCGSPSWWWWWRWVLAPGRAWSRGRAGLLAEPALLGVCLLTVELGDLLVHVGLG